jgi:hypothetical protein
MLIQATNVSNKSFNFGSCIVIVKGYADIQGIPMNSSNPAVLGKTQLKG